MAKKATKQPKAKTAYELLGRVCEAIKAHPLSYYQRMWAAKPDWCFAPDVAAKNECGTVFCRAGWLVALNDGNKNIDVENDVVELKGRFEHIQTRAKALLDMSDDDVRPLFSESSVTGSPGTTDYVRQGVRGIRDFMRKHEAHLKARSLRGV